MITKSKFTIIGSLLALGIFLSGCNNMTMPALGEGEFDTEIPLESNRYDLRNNTTDGVIEVKFINRSDVNLYFLAPGGITLQKWNGKEWKDRGRWYRVPAVVPRVHTLAPGDTLGSESFILDLRNVTSNMDIISSSGLYRIHFEIYRDEDVEELIPEADRVSDPFEVIL